MEALLVERDPLLRDQIKVALQQFPEFKVTVGSGYAGINELRSRAFDCVILGVDPKQKDTIKLLYHLRSFDTTTELFVVATAETVKDMAGDKARFGIHSFVQAPLVLRELFGLLGRFVERRTERSNSALRRAPRPAPASVPQDAPTLAE